MLNSLLLYCGGNTYFDHFQEVFSSTFTMYDIKFLLLKGDCRDHFDPCFIPLDPVFNISNYGLDLAKIFLHVQ